MKTGTIILLLQLSLFAQNKFDDFFLNKTLRIDYYHTGSHDSDYYSIDQLKEEPFWGGSKKNLIDNSNVGSYKFIMYDFKTGKEIFSHTYSTLFDEWQTTAEADSTVKSFSETVTAPFPKSKVKIGFFTRNRKNILIRRFEYSIDPKNYFISAERNKEYNNFQVQYSGNSAEKGDIVILPEGYTEDEMNKFKEDCKRFAGYLFNASPFRENKDKFNIWGVEAPSEDSGTDIPPEKIWKKTILNTNFYTFDLERYLMTADNKSVRDLAANAPYDQIYILVNTGEYGGGSIYNHYSVCTSDNKYSEYIFVHEFGHGFASLADEYYTSDVSYKDFYPLDIEPLDPNLTTLVDFNLKWKDLVADSIPIPTPSIDKYKNSIGAFEGGGYMAEGIYRPMMDCTMKSISVDNFCPVCKRAILQMIDFYTE
ncbi:MAG: M64 family metallopeptidase [Ignavibacteria bacterium]